MVFQFESPLQSLLKFQSGFILSFENLAFKTLHPLGISIMTIHSGEGGQGALHCLVPIPFYPGSCPIYVGSSLFVFFDCKILCNVAKIFPYFSRFMPPWESCFPPPLLPPPVHLPFLSSQALASCSLFLHLFPNFIILIIQMMLFGPFFFSLKFLPPFPEFPPGPLSSPGKMFCYGRRDNRSSRQ